MPSYLHPTMTPPTGQCLAVRAHLVLRHHPDRAFRGVGVFQAAGAALLAPAWRHREALLA